MKKMGRIFIALILVIAAGAFAPQQYDYQFAVMKYNGGGDWYANPTAMPNLVEFCNKNLHMKVDPEPATVEVGSPDIFNYPFVHMTGHGNVVWSNSELDNLRNYLKAGGFLHIDDNYGMDKFIRPQLNLIFPGEELVELSYSHPIYHQKYDFPKGLPKIHEHDNKAPQGFGLFYEGRLVLFYSYESDLGDGWEDEEVHNDSPEKRKQALEMGANIVQFAMMADDITDKK